MQTELKNDESVLVAQNGRKTETAEAGSSAKRFLRRLGHAKRMRARPQGLAVGMREGAGTKEISKAKLMELSDRLNIADEGEIFSSC